MTEEVSPERVDLIASISSQVADGIGPLISELVEKKIKDQKDQRKGKIEIPALNHPGLKAQAELLARWIQDVEEIDAAPTEESRRERTEGLKKSLKRRLTTVVGADTDSTIFHLADAYEKVESVIDESDDFGKAVADHLKKSAAKATEAKKKPRVDYPFRRGGYPAGTGVPAPAFTQFPTGEAQLYTRALSAKCATESTPLDWHFSLDEDENFELEYWQERLNGEFSKRFDERTPNPTFLLLTDASSLGLGAVLYGKDKKETIFTNIPQEHRLKSSTYRELLAVEFAVNTWQETLTGYEIELRLDNQSAVIILRKGSSDPALHNLAHRILEVIKQRSIELIVRWIPRKENWEADLASRTLDFDDWAILPNIANLLQNRWGKAQVDMFASEENAQTYWFVGRSRTPSHRQIGTDALSSESRHIWNAGTLWLVPPPSLIHAAVHTLKITKGNGILGMPYWPSHRSFSAVKRLGGEWIEAVKDGVLFPTGTKIFSPPSIPATAFPSQFSSFPFLFIFLDFSPNPRPKRNLSFQ
ncbi:hypothetical protein Y032_0420g1140 [Ancylostoma ceylanicum]|uniref:Reverse transcriptase RNase H-like domain-containing protein n=1 Tax=Ancylostoma ceylanicum TaxID=53326 RepID=A0A016X182_9BILA|nr:hypothetical protein Y032_0420g1140 [Ancylostoma ceylanicum]